MLFTLFKEALEESHSHRKQRKAFLSTDDLDTNTRTVDDESSKQKSVTANDLSYQHKQYPQNM